MLLGAVLPLSVATSRDQHAPTELDHTRAAQKFDVAPGSEPLPPKLPTPAPAEKPPPKPKPKPSPGTKPPPKPTASSTKGACKTKAAATTVSDLAGVTDPGSTDATSTGGAADTRKRKPEEGASEGSATASPAVLSPKKHNSSSTASSVGATTGGSDASGGPALAVKTAKEWKKLLDQMRHVRTAAREVQAKLTKLDSCKLREAAGIVRAVARTAPARLRGRAPGVPSARAWQPEMELPRVAAPPSVR